MSYNNIMFKNPHIGLDISDESSKFVELVPFKNGIKLGKYGKYQIPFGSAMPVLSPERKGQAIVRAILKKDDMGTYMILDIGKKFTGIYIVSHGRIMFSSLFPVGGNMFTKIIERKLKTSFQEAENIKMKHGLDRQFFNEKTFLTLLDGLSVLRDEISRRFLYWHTRRNEENKGRPQIEKIILCGGGSNLVGLSEYISANMKIRVELANVWINILDIKKHIPEMSFEESLSYAPAIGLALENFKKNR